MENNYEKIREEDLKYLDFWEKFSKEFSELEQNYFDTVSNEQKAYICQFKILDILLIYVQKQTENLVCKDCLENFNAGWQRIIDKNNILLSYLSQNLNKNNNNHELNQKKITELLELSKGVIPEDDINIAESLFVNFIKIIKENESKHNQTEQLRNQIR